MFHVKHFENFTGRRGADPYMFYVDINIKTDIQIEMTFSNFVFAEHRHRLSKSWKTKSYKDRQSRRCPA